MSGIQTRSRRSGRCPRSAPSRGRSARPAPARPRPRRRESTLSRTALIGSMIERNARASRRKVTIAISGDHQREGAVDRVDEVGVLGAGAADARRRAGRVRARVGRCRGPRRSRRRGRDRDDDVRPPRSPRLRQSARTRRGRRRRPPARTATFRRRRPARASRSARSRPVPMPASSSATRPSFAVARLGDGVRVGVAEVQVGGRRQQRAEDHDRRDGGETAVAHDDLRPALPERVAAVLAAGAAGGGPGAGRSWRG